MLAEALLTNFCNVVLNFAFLEGWLGLPRMGVRGVALATVISLGFGLVFTMLVVHVRLGVRLPLKLQQGRLLQRMRRVLSIGLPSALEPIAYQAMQMTLNVLIISWGAAALAARTYVSNFVMMTTILWAAAFGIATQVMVAHRVGAEDFEGANREMRRAIGFAVGGNLVLAAFLALSQGWLLRTLTRDLEIIELCQPLFFLLLLVEPARAVNIVAGGALRSSGDARYTALVGMSMMWTIGVPLCYFLGRRWGLPGIWLGMALDEFSRGIVNHRRWRSGRWKDFRVSIRPATSQA
jgi:Na+-driven multidrug efflux pump